MVATLPTELWPLYKSECQKVGRVPRLACGYHWILGDDPEAELAAGAPHLMHQINEYGAHGAYGRPEKWRPISDPAELLTRSPWQLKDAEGAADVIVDAVQNGAEDVHFWTIFPGEPIERSNARLEYFARKVVPRVKKRLGVA